MNKLKIFLITLIILMLGLLTAGISLYALNPDFSAFVNSRLKNENRTSDEVPAAPTPSEATETEEAKKDEASDGVAEALPIGYVPPADSDINVPPELSEKSGYVNITVEEKTVPDQEADRIEKELSTGPTGDDLDFDPEFYPYYALLDDRGKALYRQIYANINEMNPAFRSVDRLMTGKRIDSAFEAVFNDHPELFFVDTEYRTIYRQNGNFIEMDLFYNSTADDIEKSRSEFDSAVERIISETSGNDYEKERYVHNRLSELFDYKRNPLDQSAYSGLVTGETVCAGYARAFSYIMTRLGIPCYLCAGYAGEAHGWNIIKLDGDYYNVDVTWDDNGKGLPNSYDWFNRTDGDYGQTHIRKSLSVYLPPCNGTKYRDLEHSEELSGVVPPADDLPTLESYGYAEKDVIHDMQLYYDELYSALNKLGEGHHTFSLVIDGDILDECSKAYDENEIKTRVLDRVLSESGGKIANMSCYATELKDGYFLMEHEVNLQ